MDLLFPYQRPHVDAMYQVLRQHPCAINPSDTGTGKTDSTCVLSMLMDRPMFIVGPKPAIEQWFDTANKYGLVLLGASNYESMKNCKYYDMVETFQADDRIPCPFIRKVAAGDGVDGDNGVDGMDGDGANNDTEFEWNLPANALLIFDEAHKGKNTITINSHLVASARQAIDSTAVAGRPELGVKVIILSATICDSIETFRTAGYLLGLSQNTKHGYRAWVNSLKKQVRMVRAEGVGQREETLIEVVHRIVFPTYGHRMRIKDLRRDADEVVRMLWRDDDIQAVTYEMTPEVEAEITAAYIEIDAAIVALKNKQIGEIHPLTIILRARQRIEMLKVPTFIMQTMEELWAGQSVAIFVNFKETIVQLFKDLDDFVQTECGSFVALIQGGQTPGERKSNIAAFEMDKARLVIVNIKAGGCAISLHDLHGQFPRTSLISPPWSSIELKQVLGRIRRVGAKTKTKQRIIYCRGRVSAVDGVEGAGQRSGSDTSFPQPNGGENGVIPTRIGVEEMVAKALNKKLSTIEWLNDGGDEDVLII